MPSARCDVTDPRAPQPVAFRGGGFTPAPRPRASLLAFVACLLAWQLAADSGALPSLFAPSPRAVLRALSELASSGQLLAHVVPSLQRIVLGWLAGTLAGLVVGF